MTIPPGRTSSAPIHRALHIPLCVNLPFLRRPLRTLTRALLKRDLSEGARVLEELEALVQELQHSEPRDATTESAGIPSSLLREALRLTFVSSVLYDLVSATWRLEEEDGQLYILPLEPGTLSEQDELTPQKVKGLIRATMRQRVQEQLAMPGAQRLVRRQEKDGRILRLLADGPTLSNSLACKGPDAIQPYLQLARKQDGKDPHTGLELYQIFRYLRFFWSFPYRSIPGRELPILIRDAGQPDHPVCGMLCFASPLLRLTARDDELGLTRSWLEAVVAGLDFPAASTPAPELRRSLTRHFHQLLESAGRAYRLRGSGPTPERLLTDLSLLLLGTRSQRLGPLVRGLAAGTSKELASRLHVARSALVEELGGDLERAILGISSEGLLSPDLDPLMDTARILPALHELAESAQEAWKKSRRVLGGPGESSEAGRVGRERLLFQKKRAVQLETLLEAWLNLKPLLEANRDRGEGLEQALRSATSKRQESFLDGGPALSGGVDVSRGLSEALLQRKVTLASTQIAEVTLCGAIPPYNHVLGGKLAALLALSTDARELYRAAYETTPSEIQSRMSGCAVIRSSSLVALTTSSLYWVGSSQYNRVVLPPELGGARWKHVGMSRGHGTLHFSARTIGLAREVLITLKNSNHITSTFGEGPSERLRKLRDAFAATGLPADELLRHGHNRLVYTACLTDDTRPGIRSAGVYRSHVDATAERVIDFWRTRWLAGRLTRRGSAELEIFSKEKLLLSCPPPSPEP